MDEETKQKVWDGKRFSGRCDGHQIFPQFHEG
jgi:hypothetical protein